MTTIYAQLAEQIATAIEAIPTDHRLQPKHGMVVSGPEAAFQHLQDWAFTAGYTYIIESYIGDRVHWDCLFYKNETRNTRKIDKKD